MTKSLISNETDQQVTHNKHGFSLFINVLCTLLTSTSLGILAVLIPVKLSELNISDSFIGIILSFETIAAIAICFMIPNILRLIGLKIGLLLSTFIRVPTIIIFPYFNNLELLTSAIFIHALGCYSLFILLQIWVNTIPFKRFKGLMIGLYSTSISVGLAIGPVIVNLLTPKLPYIDSQLTSIIEFLNELVGQQPLVDNTSLFIVASILSLSSLLPLILYLPKIPKLTYTNKSNIFTTIKNCKGAMFAIAMAGVSQFGVAAFIVIYGLKNGLTLADSAYLLTFFMLGSLILEVPLAWLSDFFDRRFIIVWCAFASMFCAVYLPIAIYTPIQAWILVFIWGGVIAGIYSISLTIIGEKYTESDDMVASNAGYSLMESIGGTLGIITIGIAMQTLGTDGMPYVIMFASVLYFCFALTRYPVE